MSNDINPALAPLSTPSTDPAFLASHQKMSTAMEQAAAAQKQLAANFAGEQTSAAAVRLEILKACIVARVGTTSDEIQAFADDLTADHLSKYPLQGQ